MLFFVNQLVNVVAYGFLENSLILADDYLHSPTPLYSTWNQRNRQACYATAFFYVLPSYTILVYCTTA